MNTTRIIYVAGPPIRESTDTSEGVLLQLIYNQLQRFAKQNGVVVRLPVVDPSIDELYPVEFREAIYGQIKAADGVISICYPLNVSVACEANFASFLGKPQVLLVENRLRVPRLLRALPAVRAEFELGVVDFNEVFELLFT